MSKLKWEQTADFEWSAVSSVQITNIETKATHTKIQTLMRICDVFGVTPNDLLL